MVALLPILLYPHIVVRAMRHQENILLEVRQAMSV